MDSTRASNGAVTNSLDLVNEVIEKLKSIERLSKATNSFQGEVVVDCGTADLAYCRYLLEQWLEGMRGSR